jgi:membrane associated rhomboid family serine protease
MVVWDWSAVTPLGWLLMAAFLACAVAPLVVAWKQRIPISLGMVISLLACWALQTVLSYFEGTHGFLELTFAVLPMVQMDISQSYRLVTAGWLHATGSGGALSISHVLGNVLVIALVGVPLEQRLGRSRFLAIYLIGAIAGNVAWWLSHLGEYRLALGASGAAFGLLGCYLACWPRDEIEFPLILIRKWPVALIALLKFGLEIVQVGMLHGGFTEPSSVANLAHIGGFFFCYVVGRPIAQGGPTPPEVRDGGPSAGSLEKGERHERLRKMGSVSSDPWEAAGKELEGAAAQSLEKLRIEGDELETRQAWLEELAEQAVCPECGASLDVEVHDEVARMRCSRSKKHLYWP